MTHQFIPTIDLHRHIEGSVRISTVIELSIKYGIALPAQTVEGLRPYIVASEPQNNLMDFLVPRMKFITNILHTYDDCRRIAYECVEDCKQEGMDYAELRFSPAFMAQTHALHPKGVAEAVIEGVEDATSAFHLKTKLIGTLDRSFGPDLAWDELMTILEYSDKFVGVDLAGDEASFRAELFSKHFQRVRDKGLHTTIHAGEAANAHSIWQAVKILKAERIGHGTSAIQDIDLMHYLRDQGIGIEANITSNYHSGAIFEIQDHPLKKMIQSGLLATINTDDPTLSGIDLSHEHEIAISIAGLSREELEVARLNSLRISFLSEVDKQLIRKGGEAISIPVYSQFWREKIKQI